MRENQGSDFTVKKKCGWVGERRTESGKRDAGRREMARKRGTRAGRDNNEATGWDGRAAGTISSAVVAAGVRQVHLMTHLSV